MKTSTKLILTFILVFGIKAAISFYFKGTFFYSDEACVVQKAIYFADHFTIKTCDEIANGAPGGNPMPFYSIVISPVYFFLRGMQAYYGVLLLNSLLVASLIFPLYGIIKKFIKKDWQIILISLITVFLPQIIIYEKMLMTESIFVIINIWFLYFYINSFGKEGRKNKIIATLFALMGALTRPFGFIIILAMTANELITSKNKKTVIKYLIPISIIVLIATFTVMDNLLVMLASKFIQLNDLHFILLGLKAMKDQLNSFIVTTILVPIIIFFNFIGKKDSKDLKNIRFFLIIFLFLNFIISANHIHGYLIADSVTDLLTRYINVSIIYIFLFSFIFIFRYKEFKINILNTILISVGILSLFFLSYKTTKHSLNLDLSLYYDTNNFYGDNLAKDNAILAYYFIPTVIAIILILLRTKAWTYILTISLIIMLQSGALYIWLQDYGKQRQVDPILNYFKNDEYNMLFINSYKKKSVDFVYWRILTLTNNTAKNVYINDLKTIFPAPNFESEKGKKILEGFDYVVSPFTIKLPHVLNGGIHKVYRVSETSKIAEKISKIIKKADE